MIQSVDGFSGSVTFVVVIDDTLPCSLEWIYNFVQIDSDEEDAFESNNPYSEQTPVDPGSEFYAGTPAASCPKTPRYYKYTFRDDNQPVTWQTYCYIISSNGYPGVESQARICSVPGFDHVYRTTKMVYEGWVYTDCNSIASYGWPDWKSTWYRPKFTE
jgi:hypothetical protein